MISEANVTLMVERIDRSIRFYTEALGFRLTERAGEDAAELAGPGLSLRIHTKRREIHEAGSGTAAIGLRVPDVPAAREALAGKGVSVGRVITSGPRRIALFDDPDGNHLYLLDGVR